MKRKQTRRSFLASTTAFLASMLASKRAKAFWHGIAWVPGQRPFLASSPVNQPLSGAVQYQPMLWPAATGFNYFAGIKNYIDVPNLATAPIATMTTPGSLGWPAGTLNVPMTHGFSGAELIQGSANGDNEAISIIGTNCLSIWEFQRTSDTTASIFGASASCDIVGSTGLATSILSSGVVATQSSDMYGLLLKEEWTQHGAWNHQIAFSGISALVNSGPALPPMLFNDGSSVSGSMTEGNVLSFPPGTSMPAGLSVYGPALFNAIKNYGLIVIDNGGTNQLYMGAVYDASQGAGNLPFGASTSWTNTDVFGSIIPDWNILGPMLYKTGFPMDGFFGILNLVGTAGPFNQFVGHNSDTLMIVTRDSDSTSDNISTTGTLAGVLDTGALATFCSGTTGRVTTALNQGQGGSTNFVSTGTLAPTIYQSGALKTINSLPAMLFDGSTNYFKASGTSTSFPGSGIYINAVIQLTDLLANYAIYGSDASGGLVLRINATTGIPELLTNTGTLIGVAAASIAAGSAYLISAYYVPGSTWQMWINGQSVGSGTTAVSATAGNILIGQAGPTATSFFKGLIGAWTETSLMPTAPQFGIEGGLVNTWGPMGTVTVIHTTIASDTFTGTNGTDLASHTMDTGTGWTDQVGTHFIQSNSAQPNTLTGGVAISTFASATANGVYTLTMTPFDNGAGSDFAPSMLFRYSDNFNFLLIQVEANNNAVRLYECISGSFTILATNSMTLTSGTPYTVAATFNGPTISFTVNGGSSTVGTSSFNTSASLAGIRSGPIGTPATKCSYDNLTFTT